MIHHFYADRLMCSNLSLLLAVNMFRYFSLLAGVHHPKDYSIGWQIPEGSVSCYFQSFNYLIGKYLIVKLVSNKYGEPSEVGRQKYSG